MVDSEPRHPGRNSWLPRLEYLPFFSSRPVQFQASRRRLTQSTPYTIELGPRWSLIGYSGPDTVDIVEALQCTAAEGRVTAIYHWNNRAQRWEAWLPNGQGIPGANDFSTFTRLAPYFIAINGSTPVSWPISN